MEQRNFKFKLKFKADMNVCMLPFEETDSPYVHGVQVKTIAHKVDQSFRTALDEIPRKNWLVEYLKEISNEIRGTMYDDPALTDQQQVILICRENSCCKKRLTLL